MAKKKPSVNGSSNGAAISTDKKPLFRKGKEAIKDQLLGSDPTRDYHASRTQFFGELFVQQLPLFRILTGRMMMQSDPIVNFTLDIRDAALMPAEVIIDCGNGRIKQWLQDQWDYLWNQHRTKLVNAKKMGFAAMQPIYKEDKYGLVAIKGLKDFAWEDVRALECNGKVVGFRVKGQPLYFPQALWTTFGQEFGNPYGIGCLRRSYPPWYEKWMEHGAKSLQRLRMIKDAYIGDIFWYPPNMKVTLPDGTTLSWRDMMREMGENRLSGGAMTLPMLYDGNGKELTKYSPPQDIGGGSQIFDWIDHCDKNIMAGAGVPIEAVEAPETGSGYSGRSIPMLMLLGGVQKELTEIVQGVDQHLLRPLAWLNFGGDPDYQIYPKSLVESFSDDTSGSPMGGAAIGGQPGQPQQQPVVIPPQQGKQFEEEWQFGEGRGVEQLETYGGKRSLSVHRNYPLSDAEGLLKKHGKLRGVHHAGSNTTWLWDASQAHHAEVAKKLGLRSFKELNFESHDAGRRLRNHYETYHKPKPQAIALGEHNFLTVADLTSKQEPNHKFSSTQINMPPELASVIRQLGERIDHHDLQPTDYGDLSDTGLELNSHVTVLYGLHTNDGEELRTLVSGLGPIAIQLGEVSVFHADMSTPPTPDKPKYDVLKIEVISKGLHELNKALRDNFEHTCTFPEYKPHVTIAYVKPGMGSYYAERLNLLKGKTATFDRLIFSDKNRNHLSLPLCGQATFQEGGTSQSDLTFQRPIFYEDIR